MRIRLAPKTALAALAALGLFLPFGAPLPGSCLRTIGVAGAAPSPSPSCGGDLRECLRLSADLRQTTFGGRYVTAEDVARCMEAFNACTHGTLRGGNPNPPKSPSSGGSNEKGLPQHFGISLPNGASYDCRRNGDALDCAISWNPLSAGMIARTGEVTGTLSGLTMTGSSADHIKGDPGDSGCSADVEFSGPATYVFSPDGTVSMHEGPYQAEVTFRGTCSSNPSSSRTDPATEWIGKWSPIG